MTFKQKFVTAVILTVCFGAGFRGNAAAGADERREERQAVRQTGVVNLGDVRLAVGPGRDKNKDKNKNKGVAGNPAQLRNQQQDNR